MQNLLKKILPASWAESMEQESRQWMMRCRECDFERSVWETGGIRWKASGDPVRKMRCSNCGKFATHDTFKKEEV